MKGIRDWGLGIRSAPRPRSRAANHISPRPLAGEGPGVRAANRARRALSLLEVLVSIFILAFGLLGVAALIPLGKLSLMETNVADRTGACGRAAMREVEVRRTLYYRRWYGLPITPDQLGDSTQFGAVAIDPLGYLGSGNVVFLAGNVFPRLSLDLTPAEADAIFRWGDELVYAMPDEMAPPQPGDRPAPVPDMANQQDEGNFSWFLTVCPSPSDVNLGVPVRLRRNYTVSVVVCNKRDFTSAAEHATANPVAFIGGGYGGGTIQLNSADADILDRIENDQWVMLFGSSGVTPVVAKWYRVVGVGDAATPYLTLVGPDWNNTFAPRLLVVEGVTGVYSTTVQLDADLTWTR
ncbi:MAG: prepilin-type N-terminal cleavage/methylation domain-containing protein [Pirellulales bacterium]|nr:prepilin-type N-terminal cleavage/methylation domain-containing protein [Pirellulales bacterium]